MGSPKFSAPFTILLAVTLALLPDQGSAKLTRAQTRKSGAASRVSSTAATSSRSLHSRSSRIARPGVDQANYQAATQSQLAPTMAYNVTMDDVANDVSIDSGAMYETNGEDGSIRGFSNRDGGYCAPVGYLFDWTRADLWAGTAGFVGPSNFITSDPDSTGAVEGSFGFQEGVNFGSRLPSLLSGQLGAQLGLRFLQSQLNGSAASSDSRQQVFATAGLFRRVDYGFQTGLVVDYLHDDWIYQADLLQIRGELSYLFTPCHDLGFRFTDSQQTDAVSARLSGSSTSTNLKLAALHTYRFFYRYRYGESGRGQAELQTGWTEDSGAVLGIDLKTPLQNQLGLATSATYLIPPQDASPSFSSEGWNLSMAIVWTPGRCFGQSRDYYRPLFDVADNGSLLSRIVRN